MTNYDPTLAAGRPVHKRLDMLDGWRALSILTVMAAHMLPLGAKNWGLNESVAALGMAIFFSLSGFLVVSILLRDHNILAFVIKRVARIMPLAWVVLIVVLTIAAASAATWRANLLFYANLPPFYLQYGGHFWSLSVEMQFYAAVGLTVALAGARGLWLVPVASIGVTVLRILCHESMSIVTWFRIDEILAGGTLALLLHTHNKAMQKYLGKLPFLLFVIAFTLSTTKLNALLVLSYLRPYLVATMIGITIVRPVPFLSRLLVVRPARYIATISYALYIFHPYSMSGWLASGGKVEKYAKRPLCFALTFFVAHVSTFHYERPINRFAHRISASRTVRRWMRSAEK